MKTRLLRLIALVLLSTFSLQLSTFAQATAFTYQGRLNEGGNPATGLYDLRFGLWNAASSGAQIGGTLNYSATGLSNGLFTIVLDFGAGVFTGDPRWLELAVRTNAGSVFTTLSPRQSLTPAPYAITAANLASGGLSAGIYANAITLNHPANQLSGTHIGNGANLTNVNAATLNGLTSAGFWKTNGNAGANPANGAFLGTTDNQPLELRVNNSRALRIEPTLMGPNIVAGYSGNRVSAGVLGATISGGGALFDPVLGGQADNIVGADHGTIGGGFKNHVDSESGTVSGGARNQIQVNSGNSVIGGGGGNTITNASYSTISGGGVNRIMSSAFDSTIGGGSYNTIQTNAYAGTISGGLQNQVGEGSRSSTIAGGQNNTISNSVLTATISGGADNTLEPYTHFGVIAGGWQNALRSSAFQSVIAGGQFNAVSAASAVVGGGEGNAVNPWADHSLIAGGHSNQVSMFASGAAIGGGRFNTNAGVAAMIPGGERNQAAGSYAFAAGHRAKALHEGAFVWADATDADFPSGGSNQFLIRAAGGVGINTTNPTAALEVAGSVKATSFQGDGGALTRISASTLTGGTVTNSVAFSPPTGAPFTVGNTQLVSSLNADLLDGLHASAFWQLNGNSATTPGTHFLGTTDNQALEIKVNGARALRLEPNTNSPNFIAGYSGNIVSNGFYGAVIAGGGDIYRPNRVGESYASVLGGFANTASGFGSTAMGYSATASGFSSTAMGYSTIASSDASTAMGYGTVANNQFSTAIGKSTRASGYTSTAMGYQTSASSSYSTAMGYMSTASGLYSTAMGKGTTAANDSATAMGLGCTASGWDSVAMGTYSVAGGHYALAAGSYAHATNQGTFVWADSSTTTPFGSTANDQFLVRASAGVGINLNNPQSTLHVNGTARVEGGNNWNVTGGEGDFRVGNGSYRLKIGVASAGGGAGDVWLRAHGGTQRLFIKTPGGTSIFTDESQTAGVSLAANGTAWAVMSDRNQKKDFAPVDSREILERLAAMPITQWHYHWEQPLSTPHIGPMAQDFKAAFYPGTDDKSITTQEADGVALAAIQGLNLKVESENASLRSENAKLKERLEKLEQLIHAKLGVEK